MFLIKKVQQSIKIFTKKLYATVVARRALRFCQKAADLCFTPSPDPSALTRAIYAIVRIYKLHYKGGEVMNTSPHYYSNRNKEVLHYIRLQMVHHAKNHSIQDTARVFNVARTTVRLWKRRHERNPHAKLYDRRLSTTTHPYRMDDEWEKRCVALVKER